MNFYNKKVVILIKNEIIQTVYEQFCENGYSTSLSEIAKASGLKKQSLYNYFDSKEDLFLEMIEIKVDEHYCEQIIDLNSYENLDTIAQLENAFKSLITSFKDTEKLKFWKRLFIIENSTLLRGTEKVIKRNEYPFSEKLREILFQVIKTRPEWVAHRSSITLSYVSLIYGILDCYLLFGDEENLNKYIEDVWSFFAQGLQSYIKDDTDNNELEEK